MDVTQLVRQATPIEYSTLARGHVYGGENHPKAAPTTFTERVWVILPEGSSEHLYGPCKWLAGHGTTKPQPGSECVVGFDEQNQPTLVWWEGVQTEPTASGTAGGDLEGSYPNPTIKAEAVTAPKLAKVEAFKAVSFEHSWANFEGGFTKAGYMKDLMGFTHIRGLIKAGETGKSAFTLPAGYRPGAAEQFVTQDGGGVSRVLEVTTAGLVIPEGSNVAIRLTGYTFYAEA